MSSTVFVFPMSTCIILFLYDMTMVFNHHVFLFLFCFTFLKFQNTCLFSYNATQGTGIYGVSVQIEDFARTAPSVVLSSVPLQFLVLVFSDSLGCHDAPTFVLPTPPEGSCHVVTSTFTKTLVARTKSAAHTLVYKSKNFKF